MVPSARPERRNLSLRVASTLVLAPLVIGAVALGGGWFVAGTAVAVFVGIAEWMAVGGGRPATRAAIAATLPVAAAMTALLLWGLGAAATILALATLAAFAWARATGRGGAWGGLPYLGIPALALVWLREAEAAGFEHVLWLFLVVWATDIGGYVVGRLIGGPRLAPAISPKKTWSGAIGGLAAATATGFGVALWLGFDAPALALIGAAVLSVVAQCGDLAESAWKRRHGTKDSGTLIPGHGGLLDRLDGLLAAAPVFALLHAAGIVPGISAALVAAAGLAGVTGGGWT